MAGEKACDPERIGLWGSSYSGGHVVYVTAREPRVKAFVSQVGAMDSRWAIANPQMRQYTFGQGTARARGKLGYSKPGEKFGKLTEPPTKELIKHVPIPNPGFAPNHRVRMLRSRSHQGKAGNTAICLMTHLRHESASGHP